MIPKKEAYSDAFEKNLNIIKTAEEMWGYRTLYLADGSKIFYDYSYPCYMYVDVNGEKGPSDSDTRTWPNAKFSDWDDLYEQDWPNVQLTDIFAVEFKSNGTNSIVPYSYGGAYIYLF